MTTEPDLFAELDAAEAIAMGTRCGAPSENADVTRIYCELPEGHTGNHEATMTITWSDEP